MSGERLHHPWQANAASNNPMQKPGAGDSYPGDEALHASDLERWMEWNHGILQLVPVLGSTPSSEIELTCRFS